MTRFPFSLYLQLAEVHNFTYSFTYTVNEHITAFGKESGTSSAVVILRLPEVP